MNVALNSDFPNATIVEY